MLWPCILNNTARNWNYCNGVGQNWQGSQGCVCVPNFTKLGEDKGRSRSLFQSSDILLHFPTRVARSWVMLETTQNFTLWPLVKIRGQVGEISIPILLVVEALPTTEPSEYIWWPSTAWLLSAMHWLKKESSWVKLKAFRSTGRVVRRPTYALQWYTLVLHKLVLEW